MRLLRLLQARPSLFTGVLTSPLPVSPIFDPIEHEAIVCQKASKMPYSWPCLRRLIFLSSAPPHVMWSLLGPHLMRRFEVVHVRQCSPGLLHDSAMTPKRLHITSYPSRIARDSCLDRNDKFVRTWQSSPLMYNINLALILAEQASNFRLNFPFRRQGRGEGSKSKADKYRCRYSKDVGHFIHSIRSLPTRRFRLKFIEQHPIAGCCEQIGMFVAEQVATSRATRPRNANCCGVFRN